MDDKKIFKAWGKIPTECMKSSGYDCPHCGWFWEMSIQLLKDYIIGFEPKDMGENRPKIVGVIYVECPVCFTRFYFHVSESFMHILDLFSKDQPKEK